MPTAPHASWPSMGDYQEAIQVPKTCFAERRLLKARPVLNKLGLPRPVCGQFASVYQVKAGGLRFAIKCFLRNTPDLHRRYAKIAEHLGTCTLPYFVAFDYLERGIRIRGDFYPIVRMEWVDGLALNHFVEKILSDPAALKQLEQRWARLLDDLRSAGVAHGDLQHGNVLVVSDGSLKLIDYDGMWVPPLQGEQSHETGHPDYQSPLRTKRDFDAGIDEFAGNVIWIALRALAAGSGLWDRYNKGDNLLFDRLDFLDPAQSQLLRDLHALQDAEVDDRLDVMIQGLQGRTSLPVRPQRPPPAPVQAASGNVIRGASAVVAPVTGRHAPVRAAPPSRGRSPAEFVRVLLLLLLAPVIAWASFVQFTAVPESGALLPMILVPSFGLAALLGLLSLASLVAMRSIHTGVSTLFFGLTALLMLLSMLAAVLEDEWSGLSGDDPVQCALMLWMLASGALGLRLGNVRSGPSVS